MGPHNSDLFLINFNRLKRSIFIVLPLLLLGDPVAGKYGYPGFCDTNYLTLNTLFQHVVRNHNDIAYVLWTGDVPSHDVWNQTEAGQTSAIHQASAFLEKYFPHIKGIITCFWKCWHFWTWDFVEAGPIESLPLVSQHVYSKTALRIFLIFCTNVLYN